MQIANKREMDPLAENTAIETRGSGDYDTNVKDVCREFR